MKQDLRKINIIYNYETDDTKIILTKEFNNLAKIHQLDALQDAYLILTDIYNQKLNEFHNSDIEGDNKQGASIIKNTILQPCRFQNILNFLLVCAFNGFFIILFIYLLIYRTYPQYVLVQFLKIVRFALC